MERLPRLPVLITALAVLGLASRDARAVLYETQEKALARVFPAPARVVRSSEYLTAAQKESVARAADAPVESAVVTRYTGFGPQGPIGTAYFDSHVVRTTTEVLMIVLAPDHSVRSVDVLAFNEPEDYLPRGGWLKRLGGKTRDDGLYVGRALAHVTGATLTTRAIAAAVRRAVALDVSLPAVTMGTSK